MCVCVRERSTFSLLDQTFHSITTRSEAALWSGLGIWGHVAENWRFFRIEQFVFSTKLILYFKACNYQLMFKSDRSLTGGTPAAPYYNSTSRSFYLFFFWSASPFNWRRMSSWTGHWGALHRVPEPQMGLRWLEECLGKVCDFILAQFNGCSAVWWPDLGQKAPIQTEPGSTSAFCFSLALQCLWERNHWVFTMVSPPHVSFTGFS